MPVLRSQPPRKRRLIDFVDKFGRFSFAKDFELTINNSGLETTGRECSREDQLTRVLGYVYEAAGTRQAAVEQADVDITARVDLRHAEAGEVQSTAVIEIEHLVLIDNRIRR